MPGQERSNAAQTSDDPMAEFAARLEERRFEAAADLIPELPTDRGRSAAQLLEAALSQPTLEPADLVVARFVRAGHMPAAVGSYVARLYVERGVPAVRAFVDGLASAALPLGSGAASAIVAALSDLSDAELFATLGDVERDSAIGSAVVRSLAKHSRVDTAMDVVDRMLAAGTQPSLDALRSVTNALVRLQRLDAAVHWIDKLASSGVTELPGGTLISELVAQGNPDAAERVLTTLVKVGRQLHEYHVIPLLKFHQRHGDRKAEERIAAMARSGGGPARPLPRSTDLTGDAHAQEARLLARIGGNPPPGEREFGLAIRAWSRAGDAARAEQIFELLLRYYDPPSPESYGNLMAAWRRGRRPDRVQQWFDHMRARGVFPNERHTSVLLHAYKEAGQQRRADELAQSLKDQGVPVSNRSPLHNHLEQVVSRGGVPSRSDLIRLVRDYASHAEPDAAEDAVDWMRGLGVAPGSEGWDALFSAWEQAGRIEQMASVLERMTDDRCPPTDEQLRSLARHEKRAGRPTTVGRIRRDLAGSRAMKADELRGSIEALLAEKTLMSNEWEVALADVVRLGDINLGVHLLTRAAETKTHLDVIGVRKLLVTARTKSASDAALAIFRLFEPLGIIPDEYDFNEVLRTLADAGRASDARTVFDNLLRRHQANSFHFHSLLRAYAEAGQPTEVLRLFDDGHGVARTRHHFGAAINAAAELRDAERAVALLDEMMTYDIAPSAVDVDKVMSAFRPEQAAEMQAVLDRATDCDTPVDERHIHRLMRAWRISGDLREVQEAFDSLASFGLRPNSFHFTELIGAHLDAGRASDTVPLFQRALDAGAVDESLLSLFVIGAGRLQRFDLADWAIGEAADIGQRPDAAAMASMLVAQRRSGRADATDALERTLREAAETSSPDALKNLARRLASEGAAEELATIRRCVKDGSLAVELAAEQVIAHSIAAEPARAEETYWQLSPSAAELDPRTLQAVVAALCRSRRPQAALDAFDRLSMIGTPSSKIVGALMDVLTPVMPPSQIEDLLRRAETTTPLAPREHGILFNLALRAYARTQLHDDVLRLRDEMVDRGLPIDRFTLGPLQRVLDEQDVLGAEDRRIRGARSGFWDELGVLLDDVIHELTAPAMRIGGVTKRLRSQAHHRADDELTAAVDQLVVAADALVDRLAEYAVLAQADAGEAVFDVRDVLRWVVARTERQATVAGVAVQWSADTRGPADGFKLHGQAVFFRIAIRALVSNAIEALASSDAPRGERRVWLSAMHTAAYPSAGWIDLYVRDNGPGIASEIRERVFERGFTTKEARGLGLGLSLVESVADLFGGYVTLTDSTTGAEFFLRFPAAPIADEEEAS